MTSPRVIELPRRLEPVGRDTFLAEPPRTQAQGDNVVALRPPPAEPPPAAA